MKITKQLAVVAILFGLGLPALAQTQTLSPTPGPGGHGGHHHREWGKDLNLTDAQKTQIQQIRKTTKDRAARDAAINKVLTPDQQAKWAADKAKHQQHDN